MIHRSYQCTITEWKCIVLVVGDDHDQSSEDDDDGSTYEEECLLLDQDDLFIDVCAKQGNGCV